MNFYGYKRVDGRAGIRNHVLILPTCACGSESARIVASQIRGEEIICVENIPIWHKVALKPIGKGDKIFKYGEIIGEASIDIAKGGWVSHENIFSVPRDYESELI